MSNRFGRNQRRAMRAMLQEQISATAVANRMCDQERRNAKRDREYLSEQHVEELRAARMARDTIRITIDALLDPREQGLNMRMAMENVSRHDVALYSSVNLSERDVMRKSDIEREAFIKLIGAEVANHALAQIIRHWRSR